MARYTAVSIINLTSTRLKKQIADVRELTTFPWEKDMVQTPEQLTAALNAIAVAFGADHRVKKSLDDPPWNMARKKQEQ